MIEHLENGSKNVYVNFLDTLNVRDSLDLLITVDVLLEMRETSIAKVSRLLSTLRYPEAIPIVLMGRCLTSRLTLIVGKQRKACGREANACDPNVHLVSWKMVGSCMILIAKHTGHNSLQG